jgi:cell pole-organizing protein PopZ
MSAQPKPSEPSMEEILASIRRIIADDEVKPAEDKPAAVAEQDDELKSLLAGAALASGPATDDDVLDLGAEASLVLAPEPPAPEPVSEVPASGDVDFREAIEEPAAAAVVEPPEPENAPPAPAFITPPPQQPAPPQPDPPSFDMAQLLSDQASTSVTSAFGQLAHTVLSNNARTLEDLVKDMLKPMLKTWLDDNLPTMVERLVRAEIERVARGGRH